MIEVDEILKATAEVYGVGEEDIKGFSQQRMITEARQMAMYLCNERVRLSHGDMSKEFGRTRSTIIHSLRKIDGMLEFDRLTKRNYELINEKLNGRI